MSKGKFKFNGVQKQKGRPTIVNGIEGQRYVVNKYLENLMTQQAVGRSDDYRVYTSVSNYQEYDAFADETLTPEQQQGAGGAGASEEGQQGWSGEDAYSSQEQPAVPDEQRWSQQAYEQQITGQQPALQDQQWAQQGGIDPQMSGQQPDMQGSPWGQQQENEKAQQPFVQDQPWGTPPSQAVAQPQPQPISQSHTQEQVQTREQQSSSQSMLRNLFSDSQPQQNQVVETKTQPAGSMAPPQPSQHDQQQSVQESRTWQGEQQHASMHRNSQEINWTGPQQSQLDSRSQAQQQPQQLPQQVPPLQPPQHQFAQTSQPSGRERAVDPQEQQQWHRVPQAQQVQQQQMEHPPMQPQSINQQAMQPHSMQGSELEQQPQQQSEPPQSRKREQAPKTMMFEKPRPRTNEMAKIRRTQDGFEVTRTQQAMQKLDQQFFAAEEALNMTFPMPNAKGIKRQQEKKNKNVVKSVRGTVEFLVHANGRTFTPTYNMVGVLTAVEVSDGFVLTRGERGDSSWTMTDKDGNSVEEDPIVGVAFDKKGNLWYETADGRRTTFNVDGTTKTAIKDQ